MDRRYAIVRSCLRCSSWLALLLFSATCLQAQIIGGRYASGWLVLPPSAATTALAGWQINPDSDDPALANFNPASLNAATDRVLHVGQDFFPAGIARSILAGGAHVDRLDIDAGATLQYVNFGDFTGRDEGGNLTADFRALGYALSLQASRDLAPRLRVGVGLTALGERIDTYSAFGLSLSGGLLYQTDTTGLTVVGVQFQHLGRMLNQLTDEVDPLPLDLSIGFSRRLRYLPLRFGILYRKLDRWNLLYDDPATRDDNTILSGGPTERSAAARGLDNFGRHLSINGELLLGKREVVRLRAGYDRQRQQENKVRDLRSLAGFSFGAGVHTRRWRLDYGHTVQHRAGGANHLSLLVDFTPGPRRGGS